MLPEVSLYLATSGVGHIYFSDSITLQYIAGGWGSNYSGDIFIAFSTAHEIPRENTQNWTPAVPRPQEVLDTESINALFEATFEAVEEAICAFTFVVSYSLNYKDDNGARTELTLFAFWLAGR